MLFYRIPNGIATFEFSEGWPDTISNAYYPSTFSFSSPISTATEAFEYSEGWPDTIPDINYALSFSFSSPISTGTENFSIGW